MAKLLYELWYETEVTDPGTTALYWSTNLSGVTVSMIDSNGNSWSGGWMTTPGKISINFNIMGPWVDLTFLKNGYDPLIVRIEEGAVGGYVSYIHITAEEILPSIKETIRWEANVPDHGVVTHNFYLFSLYGTNTNNTIGGFQISQGSYRIVNTSSMSRIDDITTSNVSQYDCLTIIAENFDGSNISGIYDNWIQNGVI